MSYIYLQLSIDDIPKFQDYVPIIQKLLTVKEEEEENIDEQLSNIESIINDKDKKTATTNSNSNKVVDAGSRTLTTEKCELGKTLLIVTDEQGIKDKQNTDGQLIMDCDSKPDQQVNDEALQKKENPVSEDAGVDGVEKTEE